MDNGPSHFSLPLYEAPASRETAWRQWRHPVVRDLAWVLASPPLLQPGGATPRWLNEAWGERAFRASTDWLAALERHPAPLHDVLAKRPGRLGTYFETLLAFWLGWPGNPLYRLVGHNLPVRSRNRTLGELDFLVEDRASGELQHWEVAVKFYLGVAPGGDYASWIGPGLKDRLDLKVAHLVRHQLGLTARPEAAGLLRHLGLPMPTPVCLLRGRLFYPPGVRLGDWSPAAAAPGHSTGWWMSRPDFLARFAEAGLHWIRQPKEHWLAPVDLAATDDEAVPIGEPQEAFRFVEALEAANDNRAAAVVGLLGRQEVTRGFITPAAWPRPLEPA